MHPAVWNDAYSTGDPVIDQQHRHLLTMVNSLNEAVISGMGKDAIGDSLHGLVEHVSEHFATEERMMQSAGYPGFTAHKSKHDDLAAKARDLLAGYRDGRTVLTITLSSFLADWLRHHINEEDKALAAWRRRKQAG